MKKKQNEKSEIHNDVIAKMIGLEQRMDLQFRKKVPYNQTNYYKDLSDSEKRSFNSFVNTKKSRGVLKLFILVLPLLLFGFMQFRLTGNVVYEVTGVSSILLAVFFVSIFVVLLALMLLGKYSKDFSERKLRGHVRDAVIRMGDKR